MLNMMRDNKMSLSSIKLGELSANPNPIYKKVNVIQIAFLWWRAKSHFSVLSSRYQRLYVIVEMWRVYLFEGDGLCLIALLKLLWPQKILGKEK